MFFAGPSISYTFLLVSTYTLGTFDGANIAILVTTYSTQYQSTQLSSANSKHVVTTVVCTTCTCTVYTIHKTFHPHNICGFVIIIIILDNYIHV